MRPIDADELMEHIGRDRLDSREAIMGMVENAPTIHPEQRWIPVTKESVIQAGYEGREVRFRLHGRLFAIRELAQ